MVIGCPECGDNYVSIHPIYRHHTYGCGYSTGHAKSTPCGKLTLVVENNRLNELAVAKKCLDEAVATNATLREQRDELVERNQELEQVLKQRNAAIDTLNEEKEALGFQPFGECARLQGINKTLTEQSAALADANIKLVQGITQEEMVVNRLKFDKLVLHKQLEAMQATLTEQLLTNARMCSHLGMEQRIAAQAETIADTHVSKPSLLGWLFCD